MPTNEFLPWATAGGANVLAQADYATEATRSTGVIAGIGRSILANKTWRQSSVMAAMMGQFIADYGGLDALDNGSVSNLERDFARALQQGSFLIGVSSGTANAWALTPVPSVAAYAVGRPMLVIVPATNTSTTVTANVSSLGTRRVKKADGDDPAISDLVAGRMVWCADDGSSIRILTLLASDVRKIIDPANLVVTVFNSSATWTVPANVSFIMAECWGAGGGGGAGDGSSLGGLGGGGGIYAGAYLAVTPGSSHLVTIGTGGLTSSAPGNSGTGGGTTSLGSLLSAGGGGGGGAAGGVPGVGGVTTAGAQFTVPGGGAFISFGANGSPGGNGGAGAQGGQQGNSGQQPGGGAAGNSFTNPYVGQTGGAGRVKITYATP